MPENVMDLFRLDGRIAMVTGGCQNLGLDMATALGEAGAHLAITSRHADKAAAKAEELAQALGVRVLPLTLDATAPASVAAAFARVEESYGRLDILVNNAGGNRGKQPFEHQPKPDWDYILGVNVTATFLCCQQAVRIMMRQKSGCIINIASISGMVGRDRRVYEGSPDMVPNSSAYSAAKAGIVGLTRDLAAQMGRHGIRVNAISPGGFERGQPPEFIKRYSAKTMLGRMGRDGHDLKGAVVYLASEAASYVTGHNLVVDGGFTAWQ
jgi:NAD(P)-dependent dehydrogenase (short-subunit alcohol dehydrogenase family)